MNQHTKKLTYTALMTAFVFITTSVIKIPVPFTNGYIHAGDMCIFIGALFLGPLPGAFVGGVGSALSDFLGGYGQWILPTLFVKGLMGFIVGAISRMHHKWTLQLPLLLVIWCSAFAALYHFLSNVDPSLIVIDLKEITSTTEAQQLTQTLLSQLITIGIGVPIVSGVLMLVSRRFHFKLPDMFGMLLGGIWMVVGYYFTASLIYGSMIVPLYSIPWNIAQFVGGMVLAYLAMHALKPTGLEVQIRKLFK